MEDLRHYNERLLKIISLFSKPLLSKLLYNMIRRSKEQNQNITKTNRFIFIGFQSMQRLIEWVNMFYYITIVMMKQLK